MSDCCLTPIQQLFSAISRRVHVNYHWDQMMIRSALFHTNTLGWIFIMLAHWNNSPRVYMSLHADTLFWFRANQSLLFLLIAVCLAHKQIVFGLTRAGLEPTVYHTLGSKHYATDAVLKNIRARLCKLQEGCIRPTAESYKIYQLPAHGRWFSPGTPAFSTTKTGLHDIAKTLLKVA